MLSTDMSTTWNVEKLASKADRRGGGCGARRGPTSGVAMGVLFPPVELVGEGKLEPSGSRPRPRPRAATAELGALPVSGAEAKATVVDTPR